MGGFLRPQGQAIQVFGLLDPEFEGTGSGGSQDMVSHL